MTRDYFTCTRVIYMLAAALMRLFLELCFRGCIHIVFSARDKRCRLLLDSHFRAVTEYKPGRIRGEVLLQYFLHSVLPAAIVYIRQLLLRLPYFGDALRA